MGNTACCCASEREIQEKQGWKDFLGTNQVDLISMRVQQKPQKPLEPSPIQQNILELKKKQFKEPRYSSQHIQQKPSSNALKSYSPDDFHLDFHKLRNQTASTDSLCSNLSLSPISHQSSSESEGEKNVDRQDQSHKRHKFKRLRRQKHSSKRTTIHYKNENGLDAIEELDISSSSDKNVPIKRKKVVTLRDLTTQKQMQEFIELEKMKLDLNLQKLMSQSEQVPKKKPFSPSQDQIRELQFTNFVLAPPKQQYGYDNCHY